MTHRCLTLGRAFAATALLTFVSAAAQAADMPLAPRYKAQPSYSAPYYNWSGLYVGFNAGYAFGSSNWTNSVGVTTGNFNMSGAVAGGTVGYNFQTGAIVWGVEGDLDWSGIKGSTTVACAGGCETRNSWLGTGRLRVGYAFDRWLPYITAGAAFGDVKATSVLGSSSSTKIGWTAGVGGEWAFMGDWTAKFEYLYVDLGKGSCDGACSAVPISVKYQTNLVRAGVNYRF